MHRTASGLGDRLLAATERIPAFRVTRHRACISSLLEAVSKRESYSCSYDEWQIRLSRTACRMGRKST